MKKLIVFLTVCFIGSLVYNVNKVRNQRIDSGEEQLSWDSLPVTLQLTSSIDEMNEKAIRQAASNIEQQTGISPMFLFTREEYKNTIEIPTIWTKPKLTQANTYVKFFYKTITETHLTVNNKDFPYFVGNRVDSNRVSLESLYMHELGHVLGLPHDSSKGSIMETSLGYGEIRTKLSKSDIKNINMRYKNK